MFLTAPVPILIAVFTTACNNRTCQLNLLRHDKLLISTHAVALPMFASLVLTFNDHFREIKFVMSWMPCFLFTNWSKKCLKLTTRRTLRNRTITFDYRFRLVMTFRVPRWDDNFPMSCRERSSACSSLLAKNHRNCGSGKFWQSKLITKSYGEGRGDEDKCDPCRNPQRILIKVEKLSDNADLQSHNLL